jgi:hypothetical protein
MMDKISLTNIVFKEVAKVVVLAWINNLYDAEPRITELFFSSSEFGTLFEVLGWDKSRRIVLKIKLEENENLESGTRDDLDELANWASNMPAMKG